MDPQRSTTALLVRAEDSPPAPSANGKPRPLKIIALPRDPNPYQHLLYDEIERAGHAVRYAGELTPSHTLNLVLLPLELAACRVTGWRILHIHWVFFFKLPGSDRVPALRRLAQAWFGFVLAAATALGIRIVWTMHNVLPHQRVFADEISARRKLVSASGVVLVHSRASLRSLQSLGMVPRRAAIVTQGPGDPDAGRRELRAPGAGRSVLQLLFFGDVVEYKGVEDLLDAMAVLPPQAAARLRVVGRCEDAPLRHSLEHRAARIPKRVALKLQRVPEAELTALLDDSDAVVLPFRRVTNSSSALLALGFGRVVILPRLPAFAELPPEVAIFYDGSVSGLRRAIIQLAGERPERLRELGETAAAYVRTLSWSDAARQTIDAMASAL
jgi:glycosyltransferase involved in cell wall biosynthesis